MNRHVREASHIRVGTASQPEWFQKISLAYEQRIILFIYFQNNVHTICLILRIHVYGTRCMGVIFSLGGANILIGRVIAEIQRGKP